MWINLEKNRQMWISLRVNFSPANLQFVARPHSFIARPHGILKNDSRRINDVAQPKNHAGTGNEHFRTD